MIHIVVFSGAVFLVLEEDSSLDDSKFEDGFDSPSALSVKSAALQDSLKEHSLGSM